MDFYQISTDAGEVTVNMPFSLSSDDADHIINMFDLITRQIRRRASQQCGIQIDQPPRPTDHVTGE
jgi:hypothetical protein